jgi:chaperone BCS1
MDMLLEDVSHFLTREDFYLRRGMPYHRGYLFHGPPGTGKTSAAKAIAAYHNLDLYYMSLGDANRDVDLMEFMSSVKSRSVLLLEDVDVFQAAQQRSSEGDEDSKGISLAGLLNALDGVATPHGLIAILTSNQPDVLDQALVRPGRIDRSVEFGSLTDDSLNALFEFFYETRPSHRLSAANVGMPADAMEIFKRHMDDPQAAEAYIRGLKYNERTNGFRSFHLGANEESGGESGFHGIRDYDGSGPGHGIYSSGSHLGW